MEQRHLWNAARCEIPRPRTLKRKSLRMRKLKRLMSAASAGFGRESGGHSGSFPPHESNATERRKKKKKKKKKKREDTAAWTERKVDLMSQMISAPEGPLASSQASGPRAFAGIHSANHPPSL
ncbi:hypothetical protein EYF80_047829 [Liparis tanakae]|uniref:Uncharacterized protein n=1 Tax=Liparis tanakae TaxID=230148 RepID=A0A4Z2FM53_9TELE|nr:hypothetical protein EYF80_047829 [Liparis tanakae]